MAEAEQQRSIADLLSVLLDNTRRLIRPVHFRDIVETFRVNHGQIYLTATATTTVMGAGVYYKVAGTTALSASPAAQGFSMPQDNRLQYDGPTPRLAEVWAHFSCDTAINQLLRFQFRQVTTFDTETPQQRYFEPVGDIGPFAMKAIMLLAPGDYVELWGSNQTSPNNFTVDSLTMSVVAHAY
jgi:hypothetical protein